MIFERVHPVGPDRAGRLVKASVLEVDRNRPFAGFSTVQEALPSDYTGAALLAIERFSLAANNLSYVMVADALRTWDAFPSPTSGRGRVPVWGIARVIAADPSVATVGTRLSGFLPMATHVAVQATPTDSGLLVTDKRRAGMLPLYRRLTRAGPDSDSDHHADIEAVILPVHPFAGLLADDLHCAGTHAVVVTSASSRSAAALSRLLADQGVQVTGLTSSRHRSAVESLEVYSRILDYDDVDQLPRSDSTVYVDIAGSAKVTTAIHQQLGNRLAASIAAGSTHPRSRSSVPPAGPPVSLYNTGDRELDVVRERGLQTLETIYQQARTRLVTWASTWLQISTVEGVVENCWPTAGGAPNHAAWRTTDIGEQLP
jgi:Protein of unknown function (DUF2855)